MTSIEDLPELTTPYVAKNIASFLHVTVPEAPREWKEYVKTANRVHTLGNMIEALDTGYLFLFHRDRYREKKSYQKRMEEDRLLLKQADQRANEEDQRYFTEYGLTTETEKDAFKVADCTGSVLRQILRQQFQSGKIHLSASHSDFERYLTIGIQTGISELEERYWINLRGVPKPEIVNSEFKEKSVGWLRNEIYARIGNAIEVPVLEKIVVKQGEDDLLSLRFLPKRNLN